MVSYRFQWVSMVFKISIGFLCVLMGSYALLWFLKGVHWFLCVPMGFY